MASDPPPLDYAPPEDAAGGAWARATLWLAAGAWLFGAVGVLAAVVGVGRSAVAAGWMLAGAGLAVAAVVAGAWSAARGEDRGDRRGALVAALLLLTLVGVTGAPAVLQPQRLGCNERGRCASNLRQIGLGMILYATDDPHAAFPPDLQAVLDTQDIGPGVFVCGLTGHAPATDGVLVAGVSLDYVYAGPGLAADGRGWGRERVPVAFEPLSNHAAAGKAHGGNVLYADGSATWETPATIRTLVVAARHAGRLSTGDAAAVLDVPGR